MVKNIGIKLIDKVKDFVKKKIAIVSLALSNVEKNVFGQNGQTLSNDVNHERRNTQGQLSDSLVHGEVTQEVLNLKWRTYKILREIEGISSEIIGYDEDNMPITKTRRVDKKRGLLKIKIDQTDSYPLEMVVDNNEIVLSVDETINNSFINVNEAPKTEINDSFENITTHGSISSNDFFASHKSDKPITINRLFFPKFYIENFTEKLNVRTIDKENKLLEFYVSVYPDKYNKNNNLFLNEIKKAMNNPMASNMLEIKDVNFITYKTIGSDNFLEYKYEVTSFDKIVVFNGYYVIKFLAKVIIDGNDLFEQHRVVELDEKYKNKEIKKV